MKLAFLLMLLFSLRSFADGGLLDRQPVLNQMTGNCYTHSAVDVLTGVHLKRSHKREVIQPHPLTLGGIVSEHIGRANISSGNTCAFFNEAKKARGEFCSVQAFNHFVSKVPGMTTRKLSDNVNTFDRALQSLQRLFEKDGWSEEDAKTAVQNSRDIISSMCQLNGTINFDNPKFVQLIDDAREVIT